MTFLDLFVVIKDMFTFKNPNNESTSYNTINHENKSKKS